MAAMTFESEKFESAKRRVSLLGGLAERYRVDPELRSRIDGGDVEELLSGLGISVPPGVDARIVVNTEETFHVVLPPDPNVVLSDESLSAVAGGKSASTAGTASSLGSVCTTAGSLGTGGCVGCATS